MDYVSRVLVIPAVGDAGVLPAEVTDGVEDYF